MITLTDFNNARTQAARPAIAPTSAAPPPPAQDPQDKVDAPSTAEVSGTHFKESSCSVKRDCLLAGLMVASAFLPPTARLIVRGAGGALGVLSGFGELREGMRTDSTKEVLDGAVHMIAGGIMAASGMTGAPILTAWMTSGGVGLLVAKMAFDHPKGATIDAAKEVIGLALDSGLAVVDAFRSHPKADPTPAPAPPPAHPPTAQP